MLDADEQAIYICRRRGDRGLVWIDEDGAEHITDLDDADAIVV